MTGLVIFFGFALWHQGDAVADIDETLEEHGIDLIHDSTTLSSTSTTTTSPDTGSARRPKTRQRHVFSSSTATTAAAAAASGPDIVHPTTATTRVAPAAGPPTPTSVAASLVTSHHDDSPLKLQRITKMKHCHNDINPCLVGVIVPSRRQGRRFHQLAFVSKPLPYGQQRNPAACQSHQENHASNQHRIHRIIVTLPLIAAPGCSIAIHLLNRW